MEIIADNVNDLFVNACKALNNFGEIVSPRGMSVHELRNVSLVLTNPENNVVTVKDRNISFKYLIAEWLWYVGARQDKEGADFIVKYAPFWGTLRNNDGSLNSNYGYYFFNKMDQVLPTEEEFKPISDYYFNKSQFEYVIDTLVKDSESRQAVVNINNIYHKAHTTKDFPCTTSMQFIVRDNKLHMTVTMRSTDLVLGFCNDVFQFTMFQYIVFNELKKRYNELSMGEFTLFTASLHYYERHQNMVNNVISNSDDRIEFDTINVYKEAIKAMKELEYEDFKIYAEYMYDNKKKLEPRGCIAAMTYPLFTGILSGNFD